MPFKSNYFPHEGFVSETACYQVLVFGRGRERWSRERHAWTSSKNKFLTPYYIWRKILILESHSEFSTSKTCNFLTVTWFFFHWRVCLFRVVVYNSLVRYWRVPCLQFYWNFKIFRAKARGYIFLGIWRTIPGPLGLVSTLRNSITIGEWLIDWLTDEWFRTRNSVDSPAGRPLFDNEDEPLEI